MSLLSRFTQSDLYRGYRLFRQIEGDLQQARMVQEQHRANMEAERLRREVIENPEPSGTLGAARFGDTADAERLGLFNPAGIYLGVLDGRPIFYQGKAPLVGYAPPGAGKGRDLILPNTVENAARSLFAGDFKNGEITFAALEHRALNLRHRCGVLDPMGLTGLPQLRINPLHELVERARRGEVPGPRARALAQSYIPKSGDKKAGDWAENGARRLFAFIAAFLAMQDPENCTPGGVWSFVTDDLDGIGDAFAWIGGLEAAGSLRRIAKSFASTLKNAPKQFEGYTDEIAEGLALYETGSVWDLATRGHDFDFAALKREPHTIFAVLATGDMDEGEQWLAPTLDHATSRITGARGEVDTLMIVDEFGQLPKMRALARVLATGRGTGLVPMIFNQGRPAIEDTYREPFRRKLEEVAGVVMAWQCTDPTLLNDLSLWSGRVSVVTRGTSVSGGTVQSGGLSVGEQARNLLQVEDIEGIGQWGAVVRMHGLMWVLDRVPYYRVPRWSVLRDTREVERSGARVPAASVDEMVRRGLLIGA